MSFAGRTASDSYCVSGSGGSRSVQCEYHEQSLLADAFEKLT